MYSWITGIGVASATAGAVVWASFTEPAYEPQRFDSFRMLEFTEMLSGDALAGRESGAQGAATARSMIKQRFVTSGLLAYQLGYEHEFQHGPLNNRQAQKAGVNLVGRIEGTDPAGPAMVISAHYDHLGDGDGAIFNGADDNASGVAALVAAAEWFADNPPEHTIIFAAFDAEEAGLMGARNFVRNAPAPIEQIALNVNLDMVARADAGELYAAGAYHTPQLAGVIDEAGMASPLMVLRGHDSPADGDQDWTMLSDHAAFHEAGVPFVYYGVEDHDDYHKTSDEFSKIDPDKFLRSVEAIIIAVELFDERLDEIAAIPRD